MVKIAGGEIGRYTFQPGWRWSEHIKPVVGGDSCQTNHIGYLVSGRMGVSTDDGATGEGSSSSRAPPPTPRADAPPKRVIRRITLR